MASVILAGLGEIAITHIRALELQPGVTVLAGVDAVRGKKLHFNGRPVPVFPTLEDACHRHRADTIVVATSTSSHFAVCQQAFALDPLPSRVLVEKPGADTLPKISRLYNAAPPQTHFEVLLHFGYAPEVIWAATQRGQWEQSLGPIIELNSYFADPRSSPDQAAKRQALGNSWLDWGINALSVADRLVALNDLTLKKISPYRFEASLRFGSGRHNVAGTIVTDWDVERSRYDTVATFESGAQLHLNHFDVTAQLFHQGQVVDAFTGDGTPRRLSHYLNMYRDLLGRRQQAPTAAQTLALHRLLFK